LSSSQQFPDYPLDDFLVVTEPRQVRAIFDPLRETLLELLLERAASVQELAAAVVRPKSSVAYHVKLLADAGLLKVVRTRMVRGKKESFYGRKARLFKVGDVRVEPPAGSIGFFESAARDAEAAVREDDLRGTTRYAWIDPADAAEFWNRVLQLVNEYGQLPRTSNGTAAYALLTAMYPTQHARLGARSAPACDDRPPLISARADRSRQ
jgi:DNA-binding transcriptional ArsR family regulator